MNCPQAILRMLGDTNYANKLAKNAKQHVVRHFSIQKQIMETENVYSKCLREKNVII